MDQLNEQCLCGQAAEENPPPHLHIVDTDAGLRAALQRLIAAQGLAVSGHASAEAFLAGFDPAEHGCAIVDLAMPGLDGLALQRAMRARASHMPVIFLTGQADLQRCVEAMKQGASDFLGKPVDETVLLAAIQHALDRNLLLRRNCRQRAAGQALLATLTAREREVLRHVIAGRLNKQIAAELGTAEKTVKVHRARGMEKMQVRSVAELVRMVERSQLSGLDLSV
ncbi:response regulator transcription factor [Roseateles violae]|uniref:Response regulator n=1 Tax=Roseateles violae TaxID=3058042 RepID=A0ABT8DZW3_9BURK|nr:response regulator [Pelomonas sp. PFR6]MDN3923105.1 response regulator [Pelomonas sp. PFR6]